MDRETMLAEIDDELTRLRNVREILAGIAAPRKLQLIHAPAKKERHMSPEARQRIREAQKRRWAKQKKAA